jgi:hypothetical protein
MLSVRLIKLIETHAESLTREVVEDILTNQHTHSFHHIPAGELGPRVFKLFQHLGNWIGNPNDEPIRAEYEDLGRTRARQSISISEVVYSVILVKKHLRRYIRENANVIFSGDAVTPAEFMPLEIYSIQELNYEVGDFFDRALYYLIRGHEKQPQPKHHLASA